MNVPQDFPAQLAASSGINEPPLPQKVSSPYQGLTMKQLIVKVLEEHYPQGATTRKMLDFFRDAWNRDIQRENLSPQISRLYQEGIIGRVEGTREWYLIPEERRGRKPYRLLSKAFVNDRIVKAGEIVWLLPNEVGEHHEPIHLPAGSPPDPNDDQALDTFEGK